MICPACKRSFPPPDLWPYHCGCGETIASARPGLGDRVRGILSRLGVTKGRWLALVNRCRRAVGLPRIAKCRCDERAAWLDRAPGRARRWLERISNRAALAILRRLPRR